MKSELVTAALLAGLLSSCGGDTSNPPENSEAVFESSGETTASSSDPAAVPGLTESPEGPPATVDGDAEPDGQDLPITGTDSLPDESTDLVPGNSIDTDSSPVVDPDDITDIGVTPAPSESSSLQSILEEDRQRPAPGSYSSSNENLKSNGAHIYSDVGPQRVNADRVASWPGLRFGNFLVSNNPWNASAARYPLWHQEISLFETDDGYGVGFDWDWGNSYDTSGSIFSTKSFPEVIYGTKSQAERSGSFADTGLPVEIYDAPEFTIDYAYEYEARSSDSETGDSATSSEVDSEFNVVIESLFHSSCDIRRNGGSDDNGVFEMMVWLKTGSRNPSGDAPRGVVVTSDGRGFDVYTRVFSNPGYIAFVAQQEDLSGNILYSELLNHVRDSAAVYGIFPLNDTHCIANIILGTEIWHGAGTFNLNRFTVNRTY